MKVVLLKPSKYDRQGFVERFCWGFLPSSTGRYILSMTPRMVNGISVEVFLVDECVSRWSEYVDLLKAEPGQTNLVALVGVQSHQFQRALDIAAFAREHGSLAVIGGPHPMTCDTTELQGKGVSFALAEAEMVWLEILRDAVKERKLKSVYGREQRWTPTLDKAPVMTPPTSEELRRYIIPMVGMYPSRGCPFICEFCSVIQIAGRKIRSQPIETTIRSLRAAKAAGVKYVFFTSDNFNKIPRVEELLQAIVDERLGLKFFCQCDTQLAYQPELVELMAKAGIFQIFLGVESFDREVLVDVHKKQNQPQTYGRIVELCKEFRISSHFSTIIGFPSQTKQSIMEHLEILRSLGPDLASFYILTPMPGTEQYARFRKEGLIWETNLDRFDTYGLTWRHPNLSAQELTHLLGWCYREFYRPDRAVIKAFRRHHNVLITGGYALFSWMSGALHRHPMSGGIWMVRADRAEGLLPFRRKVFGIERCPLPDNLVLSASDASLQIAK